MEEKVAGLQDFAVRRAEIEEEAKANAEACQLEKEKAKATVDEMERKCIRAKEALRKGKPLFTASPTAPHRTTFSHSCHHA